MSQSDEKLYERETHIYFNELDDEYEIETYDKRIKTRFAKNTNTLITELVTDLGTLYQIKGKKKDLSIDTY